jgi:hypothetical protein
MVTFVTFPPGSERGADVRDALKAFLGGLFVPSANPLPGRQLGALVNGFVGLTCAKPSHLGP